LRLHLKLFAKGAEKQLRQFIQDLWSTKRKTDTINSPGKQWTKQVGGGTMVNKKVNQIGYDMM